LSVDPAQRKGRKAHPVHTDNKADNKADSKTENKTRHSNGSSRRYLVVPQCVLDEDESETEEKKEKERKKALGQPSESTEPASLKEATKNMYVLLLLQKKNPRTQATQTLEPRP
jgi:hypothetical protein